MAGFVAKRVRFRNGEHHSILSRPGGVPAHQATIYLANYRKRGRAANTIHAVCMVLALLYRVLGKMEVDLLQRLRQRQLLAVQEFNQLTDAAQYKVDDLSHKEANAPPSSNVIDIKRIRMRRKEVAKEVTAVTAASQASRFRYMADYLEFLAIYVGAKLPRTLREKLALETAQALKVFLAQTPRTSKRVRLGAREGLSREGQERILRVIHPDSPDNPWERELCPSAELADCCALSRYWNASWRTARRADWRP